MGSPRQVRLLLMSIALVTVSTLPILLVGSSWLAWSVMAPRRVPARVK